MAGECTSITSLGEPPVVGFSAAGLRDQFVMLLAESARPGVGSRALTEALLKKLGAKDRAHAVAIAARRGYLDCLEP